MTEQIRLRDEGGDALEHRLAKLFDDDRAPRDGKQSVARALVAAGYLPVGGPPPAGPPSGGEATAAYAVAKSTAAVWVKSLGIGLVAGTVAMGGAELYQSMHHAAPAPSASPATRSPSALAPPAVPHAQREIGSHSLEAPAIVPARPANEPGISANPRPKAVHVVEAPVRAPGELGVLPPAPVPASPSALTLEVALLDRARGAGSQARWGEANELLAAYYRQFPAGALNPEAKLLQVEILLALGRRAEALEVANRFAAQHPTSPHLRRLSSLMSGGRP